MRSARSYARPGSRTIARTLAAGSVLLLALSGCSGDSEAPVGQPSTSSPPSLSTTPPPGGASEPPATQAPTPLTASEGLHKEISYADLIKVKIVKVEGTTVQDVGPGSIQGQEITIFTLSFSNGSQQPLDLGNVRVSAVYGSKSTEAAPSYYGDLNDFFGTVEPGKSLTAGYGFVLPPSGYGAVTLRVQFDEKHSTAVFAGTLG